VRCSVALVFLMSLLSNDPGTPISETLAAGALVEMAPHMERNRHARDAARAGPMRGSE